MKDIVLTKEEKKVLKDRLYYLLLDMSEYHLDIYPNKRMGLGALVESYCYWANTYNDGYMREMDEPDNRISVYLVQAYNKLYVY